MPKRRKASQSNNNDDSDSVASGPTPSKRRRKPMVQYDPAEICQELYDTIRTYKSEEGRLVCEAFVRVPKRRTEPEYYEKISTPIDLLKIQHKLKSEEYDDIEQFTHDIQLLLNNAKTFYKKSSQEYQDAEELWDLYLDTKQELLAEVFGERDVPVKAPSEKDMDEDEQQEMDQQDLESNNNNEELDHALEELFAAVAGAKEGERNVAEFFKLLPLRSIYPAYYEVIKDPIDLKIIATRLQDGEYKSVDDLCNDLTLMVTNAKTFNEPGSQIYNDAKTLGTILRNRKAEYDREKRQPRSAKKERSSTRTRRQTQALKLSAVIAAMEYPPEVVTAPVVIPEKQLPLSVVTDFEEESGAEGSIIDGDEEDSALLCLFNAVKNYKNLLGQTLSEPFMKLPSKRMYPDYYKEIKKPISLLNIRKKIRDGFYDTLEDLAVDLDLLFNNAKQYNVDESKLYQDAVVLQKVMLKKKMELETGKKEEMDCLSDITVATTPGGRSRRPAAPDSSEDEVRNKTRRSMEEILRKRLMLLYRTLFDYKIDGRSPIDIFVHLPSKKEYPDYYQVISEPIDMSIIEGKIKADKYATEQALVSDFQLMFNNARHYNEEGSRVYQDADLLEKVLKNKMRNLTPLDEGPRSVSKGKATTRGKTQSPLSQKLQELYDTIKDHADSWGRTLSTPFIRLPTKNEYPDYYEVIKRPIDMQKISQRITGHQYTSLEDMVCDFALMFDNACRYNEPDSLIYKDALTLQRLCLEKKAELSTDDNDIPDVKAAMQELMTSLFISTYNHMDEDGRSFCDSFLDMPAMPEEEKAEGKEQPLAKKVPSFDQVKKNLDRGRYRRLDRFQQDMFEVFKYARKVSRTDSQLYEDAVELQQFFLKIRDELCRNGEHVLSPVLSYTSAHLNQELEEEKKEKLPKEQKEDEERKKQQDTEQDKETGASEASLDFQEQTYRIGDFVYIEPRPGRRSGSDRFLPSGRKAKAKAKREKGMEPHIVCIEKLWKDEQGEQWLHGCWFLRPNETYHLATRKFLQKEVFKSDFYDSSPFSQVMGKCYVMCVKDYFRNKPEGFAEKDVYVCESRYSAKHKAFKKIKIWQMPKNDQVNIVAREAPLEPVRVASVFADKIDDKLDIDDGATDILDMDREIVPAEVVGEEDGNIYYEQFQGANDWYKLGDFVYVKSIDNKNHIYRIDKLMTDSRGMVLFQGPCFISPSEVAHTPTRLFYRQEVFYSTQEHTLSLDQIVGHCAVLFVKDYCICRPTEIPEQHVYICESKYLDAEKSIRKLNKGMRKHVLSDKVCDDEIYFFKKPITPKKINIDTGEECVEPSPLLPKAGEEIFNGEETVSSQETSFNESFSKPEVAPPEEPVVETPAKEKKKRKGHISAYLVYAGGRRKELAEECPGCTFGEISKLVGQEWRELPKHEKVKYEERAKKIAEEQAQKQAEADKAMQESLNKYPPQAAPTSTATTSQQQMPNYPQPFPAGVYPQQGYPQGVYPPQGMPGTPMQQAYPPGTPQQGMMSYPRGMMGPPAPPGTPLPSIPGTPLTGGMATPHPGMPSTPQPQLAGQAPQQLMTPMPPPPPPRPPSPMFVSVPPKTQRLLHSEAYLRYIEGLTPEKRSVGDWERTLEATPENTEPNPNTKLPTHWLGQGEGAHGSTLNALWALHDLMLKDTLTISKTLEFSQL